MAASDGKTLVWVVRTPSGNLIHRSAESTSAECRLQYATKERVSWEALKERGYSVVLLEQRAVTAAISSHPHQEPR